MGSGASVVKESSSFSNEEKSAIVKKLTVWEILSFFFSFFSFTLTVFLSSNKETFDSDIKGSDSLSDEDTIKLFHKIREFA